MGSSVSTYIPPLITAGTTVKFHRSFSDYPASEGWSYSFYLAGPQVLNAGGSVVDGVFEIIISSTNTATLSAGTYRYTEIVTKAGEKYEAGRGTLEVQIDLAAATPGSAQTHAEKTLSVIEAALSGRLTSDLQSYQIAGRAVNKIPVKELLQMRGHYAFIVWQERNPGCVGIPIEIQIPSRE